MSVATAEIQLTRKDFVSDQTVRWCPGCGDYAILATMQKVLPELGVPKENIVFISGIGCSSRFPYYMNTYGIHSIHGRAPTLATGLSIANPALSIWVITGDGDGLSIGGNHLIHAMRRNVNLNIVLFNNRVYGLTKGQYSPTSRVGFKSKSSPMGSIEQPLNPVAVALAAEATFVARSLDTHTQHLEMVFQRAAAHQGVSFIEIYQNCVIFNPQEWGELQDRRGRDEHIIYLEHGLPLIFGKDREKAIRLNGFRPEVVNVADVAEEEILIHDASSKPLALLLSSMEWPLFPAPLGIIRDVVQPDYTSSLMAQVQAAQAQKGVGDLDALYRNADLWTVSARPHAEATVAGEYSITLDEEYIDNLDQDAPQVTTVVQDQLTTTPLAALQPKAPIAVVAASSLARAVRQMKSHKIGCLLVTDAADKLVGVFTERDLLTKVVGLVDDLTTATVADYMTPDPYTLKESLPIANAIHLMALHGFRHVPLIDEEGHPVGIISFRDVVDYLGQQLR